jgi:hypothetical protein
MLCAAIWQLLWFWDCFSHGSHNGDNSRLSAISQAANTKNGEIVGTPLTQKVKEISLPIEQFTWLCIVIWYVYVCCCYMLHVLEVICP